MGISDYSGARHPNVRTGYKKSNLYQQKNKKRTSSNKGGMELRKTLETLSETSTFCVGANNTIA